MSTEHKNNLPPDVNTRIITRVTDKDIPGLLRQERDTGERTTLDKLVTGDCFRINDPAGTEFHPRKGLEDGKTIYLATDNGTVASGGIHCVNCVPLLLISGRNLFHLAKIADLETTTDNETSLIERAKFRHYKANSEKTIGHNPEA